jgi:glutamate-ammonia-ligase adenylyltransferase
MPLSSQLQQQWQTVCERLPESLPASSLSEQARSVLTFSDFVQESLTANPDWLAELENAPPQADEWRHMPAGCKPRLQTWRMKRR